MLSDSNLNTDQINLNEPASALRIEDHKSLKTVEDLNDSKTEIKKKSKTRKGSTTASA